MKKNILSLALISLLLLTGCGKKVYNCQKNILDTDGVKVDREVSLTYNNKKITKEVITVKYKTSNIDGVKKPVQEQYEAYNNAKGINYYFEDVDDGFNFVIEIDMQKADKNIKEELELYTDDAKKVINDLEKDGYTCTNK